MLRPNNLLGLCCWDVVLAQNDHAANREFMEQHGHPGLVRVRYSHLTTSVAGTAPAPVDYVWSSFATDAEMRASVEFDSVGVRVRCPWTWCSLPFFLFVFVRLREAAPGFSMSSSGSFFVTPVGGDGNGWGTTSHTPVTKAWWQSHLDAFVRTFDVSLSALGVGGLYGIGRGTTQF